MKNKVIISENKALINGVEYRLGISLRTQVLYERMISNVEDKKSTLSLIVYFYAILMGLNSETFTMEFDKFFDYLDEHPQMFAQLMEWSRTSRSPLAYFDDPEGDSETIDDKKKD